MIYSVIALLAVLQVKHFLADYVFQTRWMLSGKARFLHPSGVAHAGVHAALTGLCLVIICPAWWLWVAIVIGEWVAHYLIDYTKSTVGHVEDMKTSAYWHRFGLDQLAHQLTYVAILWLVLGQV